MYIKPVNSINDRMIEQEWDLIAELRDEIIRTGKDISLLDVTEPFILESVCSYNVNRILDCGCGTGHLSYLFAQKMQKKVDGIDMSGKCIEIAKCNYSHVPNLTFFKESIIDYSNREIIYDACFANMVLMDMMNVKDNLNAIYLMLKNRGIFSFTITHPCFWPFYCNYFNEPWFDYRSEISIKAPFQVNNNLIGHTTHIHRPLSKYISLCQEVGFEIIKIEELYPKSSHMELSYKYDYPRFLGFLCQKI